MYAARRTEVRVPRRQSPHVRIMPGASSRRGGSRAEPAARGQLPCGIRPVSRNPDGSPAASTHARRAAVCNDHCMRLTVVIVDDHAPFRDAARELLESEGFAVIGTASDGGSGIELVEVLQPKVVVLDIHLPDIDGFVVADRLARLPRPPAVVLISSRERCAFGPRLADCNARGFIEKRQLSGARLSAIVG